MTEAFYILLHKEVKLICADDSCRVTVLLRCPAETSPDEAGSFPADRGHSLASFHLPLAAVGSLPLKIGNANTKASVRNDGGFFLLQRRQRTRSKCSCIMTCDSV